MKARAKTLAPSVVLVFRYAAIFGSIISLMLLTANIQRTAHHQGTQHYVSAQ